MNSASAGAAKSLMAPRTPASFWPMSRHTLPHRSPTPLRPRSSGSADSSSASRSLLSASSISSGFIGDLGLVPDWAPAHLFWAWLAGAILLLAGLSVLTGIYARLATTLLGCVFLLSAFLRFTTHIPGMLHNIGDRGVFFELLACCAGSWMLARSFSPPGSGSGPGFLPVSDALTARLATPARWLFGIALVVFGSLHLQAPGWIAGLIPHWIPFHLFFALFTGSALVAAGLAIAAQVWTRLSAALLALMLFSWVLIVHAPRIAHALHNGDEWNSGYVCLTMAGFALITAALADRKPSDVH